MNASSFGILWDPVDHHGHKETRGRICHAIGTSAAERREHGAAQSRWYGRIPYADTRKSGVCAVSWRLAAWIRERIANTMAKHANDIASVREVPIRQTAHELEQTQITKQDKDLDGGRQLQNAGAETDHHSTASGHLGGPGDEVVSSGITKDDFPFPGRADTFARPLSESDRAELEGRKEFAGWHATAANAGVARLRALGPRPTAAQWRAEYGTLIDQRAEQGVAQFGQDHTTGKERFQIPITDESPNRDQIGSTGRLRAGSVWSDEAQAWVGGEPTPASRTFEEAGQRAKERFAAEEVTGDVLQNRVRLSDGSEVDGNQIVTGEAAEQIALELKAQVAARGIDVSTFETKGEDLSFTITAKAADRERILQDAFDQLGRPEKLTIHTWADNAYKLFQAPENKRGSDSVIRTFIAEIGEYDLGRVPKFPHDIDLRANTMSQSDFVNYLVEYDAEHG